MPHFFCSTLRLGSRSLCARSYDCCPDEKLEPKKDWTDLFKCGSDKLRSNIQNTNNTV